MKRFLATACAIAVCRVPRARDFVALMLALEGAMLGLFLARDLLVFALFWDLMLVPVFFALIGWGEHPATATDHPPPPAPTSPGTDPEVSPPTSVSGEYQALLTEAREHNKHGRDSKALTLLEQAVVVAAGMLAPPGVSVVSGQLRQDGVVVRQIDDPLAIGTFRVHARQRSSPR